MRRGEIPISEPVAEAVGRALGVPAIQVYAEARAARAKRSPVREFWERVARSLAAGLAVCFLGVFGLTAPQPAQAFTGLPGGSQAIHYPQLRRRLRELLDELLDELL